jgi:thiol-disulfide isomerase/thioredoxin
MTGTRSLLLKVWFLSLIALGLGGLTLSRPGAAEEPRAKDNKPLKPFVGWKDLPGVGVEKHSLSDLKDQDVVVVAIVSNTCPKCKLYRSRLKASMKRWKQQGDKVALVAINVYPAGGMGGPLDAAGNSLKGMTATASQEKLNFLYLLDKKQQVGWANKARVVPTFYVLNKNREITYEGSWDDHEVLHKVKKHYVDDAVRKTLQGEKPNPTVTTTFGCEIRYLKHKVEDDGS